VPSPKEKNYLCKKRKCELQLQRIIMKTLVWFFVRVFFPWRRWRAPLLIIKTEFIHSHRCVIKVKGKNSLPVTISVDFNFCIHCCANGNNVFTKILFIVNWWYIYIYIVSKLCFYRSYNLDRMSWRSYYFDDISYRSSHVDKTSNAHPIDSPTLFWKNGCCQYEKQKNSIDVRKVN
jgi:hypothetical protein